MNLNAAEGRRSSLALDALRLAFLYGAGVVCLLLVFDPRYRNFPIALYTLPFVGFWLLRLTSGSSRPVIEERVLAAVLALSVPGILWREGFANIDALLWCLIMLGAAALALPYEHEHAAEKAYG